jgi:hypothetical protein
MNKRKNFFTAIIVMSACIFFGQINAMDERLSATIMNPFIHQKVAAQHHDQVERLQCKRCGKIFKQLGYFKNHELTHLTKFPCSACGELFRYYPPFSSPEVQRAALSLIALWPSKEALCQSIKEFLSRPVAQPSHSINEFYTADDGDMHGEELLDSLQQESVDLWQKMHEEFPEEEWSMEDGIAPTPSFPAFSSPEAIAAIEALAELSREGN